MPRHPTRLHAWQAFEPSLNWSAFAVSVRKEEVPRLPQLLAAADLRAKQRALAEVWSRLVWRGAMREPLRSRLHGPDAFDMTMAALGRLAAARRRSGVRRPADTTREKMFGWQDVKDEQPAGRQVPGLYGWQGA